MAAIAVAVVLLGACDGGSGESAVEEVRQRSISPSTPTCPNEERAVADPAAGDAATQRADVDGDGAEDTVSLHLDPEGPDGCRAFIRARTASGDVVGPVWEMGTMGGLPQPSLHGFVDLDPGTGAEIILVEAAGASTQFAGLYTLADGRLVKVGYPASDDGLFPFGGSVGHIEAVGCEPDGALVVTQALPGGSRKDLGQQIYDVTRRSYRLEGSQLEPLDVERSETPIEKLDRFPEFAAGPFGTCPAP